MLGTLSKHWAEVPKASHGREPPISTIIAFGIILSLALFLYRTTQPKFTELAVKEGSINFSPFGSEDIESSDVVKLVQYSGSLYFANAAFFETQMLEVIAKNKDQLKYIVVDVGALLQIDDSSEDV